MEDKLSGKTEECAGTLKLLDGSFVRRKYEFVFHQPSSVG